MPTEDEGQPEDVQNQEPLQPIVDADTLPDVEPEKIDPAKLKEEADKEKTELTDQLRQTKEEKAALEKRVKDNQDYISRTRKGDTPAEKPAKTFEQYEEEVLTEFENDPKAGLKRVLRDVAYDRDLERREFEKRLTEAEDNAFKRVVALDPEKGALVKQVQELDQERPDLSNLSFDQKMEFVKLQTVKAPPKNNTKERTEREQDLLTDAGASRISGRHEKMPSWANDPEVMHDAKGIFKSKQEMIDWADPEKAKQMGAKMRPQ